MEAGLEIFSIMMAIMVPISLITFITEYFKYKRSTDRKFGDLRKEMKDNSSDELKAEIHQLKQRVVVLESIVTDRGFELDSKISSL